MDGESQHDAEGGRVYEMLHTQTALYANNPLFILPESVGRLWGADQHQWTYRQVLDEVDGLAGQYLSAGYGPGCRVALLLENRPAHFFHWLALNAIGASAVPINPDYTKDELTYLLEHSESALLVCLPSRLGQVADVAGGLGIELHTGNGANVPVRQSVASTSQRADESALVYTSGTTGRPKGCILSNDYFLGWSKWYSAQGGFISLRQGEERLMTPLPTFHVNAMGNSFMGMLGTGGAQVIVDRFHPSTWWKMAIETKATCFHYLGVMPAILLAIPPSQFDRAHILRFGMGGGVHPDHHASFEDRFAVPLIEGWAMTETGGGGVLCAVDEPRHVGQRCIGRPDRDGPPMEVRIVGDDGVDQPANQPGELLLRARGDHPRKHFFSGYLKDELSTRDVWADGWLHTGDIMRLDQDGNLFFVDRKKNIIRRSGENIAAVEVESVIAGHPLVKQLAVVAASDPLRGEEVLAVIVRSDPEQPDNETLALAIFEYCEPHLAYYKLPGYVMFLDALPTTATQKIRKADLGNLSKDPSAHPDTFDFRELKQPRRPVAP